MARTSSLQSAPVFDAQREPVRGYSAHRAEKLVLFNEVAFDVGRGHLGSELFGEPGIDLQAGERIAHERAALVDEALIRVRLVGTRITQRAEC